MTASIRGDDHEAKRGPTPLIGAAIALSGIFLMGAAGAREIGALFQLGALTAVLGWGIFVLLLALAAMRRG